MKNPGMYRGFNYQVNYFTRTLSLVVWMFAPGSSD